MRRRVISSSTSVGTYPEPIASECATSLKVTGATRNTISLSWTASAGGVRVVILVSPTAFTTETKYPTDFTSNYTANANQTSATDLDGGTSTPKVVYDGNVTSMTVSGLSANTPYYFRLYSYKANANNNYNTRNYNTADFSASAARTTR